MRHALLSLILCLGGWYAAAADALAAQIQEGAAVRTVDGNVVISRHAPSLAIRVDDSIHYAGRHPIRIRDAAAGERLVFVDHAQGKVNRMLILQFEGFLPGVEHSYQYDLSRSPIVAGYPFRSNPYAFNLDQSRANAPGAEPAATARFLERKGITPPKVWIMWRSLTVEPPERRDELIIFYVEDAGDHGVELSDIYDPETDRSTPFWRDFSVGLEQRANAAFELAKLAVDKGSIEAPWQSIPLSLSD